MPRVFFALLAVAAALAGALWFVAGSERERSAVVPPAISARDTAPAPPPAALADSAPIRPPSSVADVQPGLDPTAEPALQREAVRDGSAVDPRAQWIEGRVVRPPGTPDDERLFVTGGSWDDDASRRAEPPDPSDG